jgi:Ca-activated chloride channel family protein
MRSTVSCLLAVILLPVSAFGAEETHVVLVLDASTAMWRPLDDGICRFAASRLAIETVVTDLAANDGVQIALRLMGSDTRFTEDSACEDTRLAFPPGVTIQRAVADTLDVLAPTGARPLVRATVLATEDLSTQVGRRRVVLVTSGDDSCSGDRRSAAEALSSGVELRIVGVGLAEHVEHEFNAVTQTRNAATTEELVTALRWAVFGPNPPTRRHPVALTLVRDGRPVVPSGVVLVDPATGATYKTRKRDQQFETQIPGGIYNATVTDERSSTDEYGHIAVSETGNNAFRLAFSARPPVTLEVVPDPIIAGAEMSVHYWGAPAVKNWVEVASPDHPLGLFTDRTAVNGPTGDAVLRAPVDEGPTEIRFLERLSDGVVRVIGRTPVTIEPQHASLDLPESVILGSQLSIGWQGPDDQGDHLVVAPARADVANSIACAYTSRGSPVELPSPPEEGGYVVHYVSGQTASTLATAKFRVTYTPVQLRAADRVPVGGDVVVEWDGPARPGDYLTLAVPDSPSGDYLSIHPSDSGSPAVFTAPREPGVYEIRYIKDADDSTEGSKTIEVYAVQVRLQVPTHVQVGTTFEVLWQGPDGPGDFISVAPEGSRWQRMLDWAFTSAGSPARLAAPFSRGRYEVRYISGSDSRALETVTITVE